MVTLVAVSVVCTWASITMHYWARIKCGDLWFRTSEQNRIEDWATNRMKPFSIVYFEDDPLRGLPNSI